MPRADARLPLVQGDQRQIRARRLAEHHAGEPGQILHLQRLLHLGVDVRAGGEVLRLACVHRGQHVHGGAVPAQVGKEDVAHVHHDVLPARIDQRGDMAIRDEVPVIVVGTGFRHLPVLQGTDACGSRLVALHDAHHALVGGEQLHDLQRILQLLLVARRLQLPAQAVGAHGGGDEHVLRAILGEIGQRLDHVARAVVPRVPAVDAAHKEGGVALLEVLVRSFIRGAVLQHPEIHPFLDVIEGTCESLHGGGPARKEVPLPADALDGAQKPGVRNVAQVLEAEARQVGRAVGERVARLPNDRSQRLQL